MSDPRHTSHAAARPRRWLAVAAAAASVVAMTACGSNSGSSSASASADWSKTGPINYVQGKDTSGHMQDYLDIWNKEHPDQKVTMIELSDQADQQRTSMLQNHQNKGASGYDVLAVDMVYTAEFAANGVIRELPSDMSTDGHIKSAVASGTYFNKLYAFPYVAGAAMLYYRTDLLKAAGISSPPTTWDQLKSDCTKVKALPGNSKLICYGGQFQKYEGLTCNVAEWVNGAGGEFLDSNGKPAVNSAAAVKGLTTLQGWVKDGTIDDTELTWTEEPSRNAFQNGNLIFLRNWSYVYAKAATDTTSKVKGKFAVAPLPGLTGLGASTLGGENLAIASEAKNLGTAKAFIQFLSSARIEKMYMAQGSNPPSLTSLYSDADLVKQFPFLPTMLTSIQNGRPRPQAVQYSAVSSAIQDSSYAALQNPSSSAQSAFDALQTKLTSLTQG